MLVRYRGPNRRIRASASDDWVQRGGEIELSETQIAALRRAGHKFDPVEGGQNLPEPEPEPEPEPVVTQTEPDEP